MYVCIQTSVFRKILFSKFELRQHMIKLVLPRHMHTHTHLNFFSLKAENCLHFYSENWPNIGEGFSKSQWTKNEDNKES